MNNLLIQAIPAVHRDKKILIIRFDYDTAAVKRFKKLPGARWSHTLKSWYLPDTHTHMRYLFTIVISFFITGCSDKQPAIDERLISFDNKFVSDVDSVLRLSKRTQDAIFSENMNSLIDTAVFKNREIYISCLSMATGCADYTGNIKYIKDTIKLELINLGDVVCTEQNCHRFIYRIANPENKRYVILKP